MHAQDARLKLSTLLIFLITTALLPQGAWAVLILLSAVLFCAMLVSELPMKQLLQRSLAIGLPFMLMLLPLLIRPGGNVLVLFHFGGNPIALTSAGCSMFFNILVKTWLSIQAAVLMSAVTRFQDLLSAMRALGYPRLMSAILGLMWRYTFILAAETQRMLTARSARSGGRVSEGRRPGGSFIWRAKVTGGMAGSLFLRSLARGERIYQAMKSRGYDGEVRLAERKQLELRYQLMIAGIGACAVLLLFFAKQLY